MIETVIDLRPDHQKIVEYILSRTVPQSVRVLVFGSRARWTAKAYSDLDIAIDAGRKLTAGELAALEADFEESSLPWKVDVVDLNAVSSSFRQAIEDHAVDFPKSPTPPGREWHAMRLGDFLELKRGYDLPQQERRDGTVPIISSSGPSGFHSKAAVKAPGVVTGRYGTLGQVFYLTQDFWPLNTALYVRSFKGNNPRYAYYLLRTLNWHTFNDKSGVPGVNRNHVHEAIVRVPDLKTQNRIAETLSVLDDKIELNRRMNETLEAMARAIFKDWFVDFGPTRAKMEGRARYLSRGIWSLFPDRLDDEGKPKEWKYGNLSELAKLNPESWGRAEYPATVNYVDLSNTKWGTIEAVSFFSGEDAPSRAQRILRPGDTIVGTVRPGNGSYSLISTDGLTGSTGFAVLRPTKQAYREVIYLCATQSENIERLAHLADGGAYPAVRPDLILNHGVGDTA